MNKQLVLKAVYFVMLISAAFFRQGLSNNYSSVITKSDLVWNNNLDDNFFNGAFIGDGVQGAMIIRDVKNASGIRMLLGHYKAVAHKYISGVDMCESRVFVGDIVISPVGTASSQTMHLDIYNGEATGTIVTNEGKIIWTAIADRKNHSIVVILNTTGNEIGVDISFQEQWAVSTAFYQGGKNPDNYISQVASKPVVTTDGDINLVTSKMNSRGAQCIASQLVVSDNLKVFYLTIGTDDNTNLTTAATHAINDAKTRLNAALVVGYSGLLQQNRDWWNNYMENSFLEIPNDTYWQKFWWLQIYKFGCTSSENAGLLIDTQGPWTTQCGWSGIWWNLNIQLSYYPLYSSNKLDAGRSLIDGMDRIYKSGVFHQNASNAGKPGIYVGRSTSYRGNGTWGDELGNMPWVLHSYWKYWKYSGEDTIGKSLFPMLKDNATFLIAKLKKESDGKYHVVESRSPEYDDSKLYKDANYALMSLDWELRTLIEMDSVFSFNDPAKSQWKEVLENLIHFPSNQNGYMISPNQGFDKGHRHYSHLLAIYPYHTVTPDMDSTNIIKRSVDRWYDLSVASGAAGYTYTGSCAMFAILNDGDKALTALNKLKPMLKPNTMYAEGSNPVIETPLSAVESINYMLLQSWGGIIRVFPALPGSWKDAGFNNFRAEGAFLVSAKMANGKFDHFTVFSEKGNPCTIKNPWTGKIIIVKDESGNEVLTTIEGDNYTFETEAGKHFRIDYAKNPEFVYAEVKHHSNQIMLQISHEVKADTSFKGFSVFVSGSGEIMVDSVKNTTHRSDTLLLFLSSDISEKDEILLSYQDGNVRSVYDYELIAFANKVVDNLLPGAPPRLWEASTNGDTVIMLFNKKLKASTTSVDSFKIIVRPDIKVPVSQLLWNTSDSSALKLVLSQQVFKGDTILISYTDTSIFSTDSGRMKAFYDFHVTNLAPGKAPEITHAKVINNGSAIEVCFNKSMTLFDIDIMYFTLLIDNTPVNITSIELNDTSYIINCSRSIRYDSRVLLAYQGGHITSMDGGKLEYFEPMEITNGLHMPDFVQIPSHIEAEDYYNMYGVQIEGTSDVGGGKNVGWIDDQDWLEYSIYVPETDTYRIEIRFASQSAGGEIEFFDSEMNMIGSITSGATGGWQNWITVSDSVSFSAGNQYIRVYAKKGGFNFNWIKIEVIPEVIPEVVDLESAVKNENSILLSPNPFQDIIHVQLNHAKAGKYALYNSNGGIVLSGNVAIGTNELDVNVKVDAGIYFLCFETKDGVRCKPVISY